MSINEMWDLLQQFGVSDQTLDIVTSINGFSRETMESVLFAHMGYRTFEQLSEEEDDSFPPGEDQ